MPQWLGERWFAGKTARPVAGRVSENPREVLRTQIALAAAGRTNGPSEHEDRLCGGAAPPRFSIKCPAPPPVRRKAGYAEGALSGRYVS